jgi:hypothetical protein
VSANNILPRPAEPARDSGGVLWLPEALERHSDRGIVVYNRVSGWDQAGKDMADLHAKTDALAEEVRRLAPGKVRRVVQGIESGKPLKPRRRLIEAAKYARAHDCIVVTSVLSRFLRAGAFSRNDPVGREAWPLPSEFARFHRRTLGVPCATVAQPLLSESESHSWLTNLTGKAGRPGSIDDDLAARIFRALGYLFLEPSGRERWRTPIATVAKKYGVSRFAIMRAASQPSPGGETWRDLALRKAADKGMLEIRRLPNGDVELVSLL